MSEDLGVSKKALYTASNHASSHYRRIKIPKGNGEFRELAVPDNFLKSIQKRIADKLLIYEEISKYATAYRYGGSVVANAKPHIKNGTVLKVDIRHFFDHIIYPIVKDKAFPAYRYSEPNRIMLSLICLYKDTLPQGAPTSPVISNIIMKNFDDCIGQWCDKKGIVYTRYCDDLTFSGNIIPGEIICFVKQELAKMGFYLNNKKTVIARNGQRQLITGVVVNDKLNIPLDYRKKLRQELYYCKKFGVSSHLSKINSEQNEEKYLQKLLGRVNYALMIDKSNAQMNGYRQWLVNELKKYNG